MKKKIFTYKKQEVNDNKFITSFFMIEGEGKFFGNPLQSRREAAIISNWLNSVQMWEIVDEEDDSED